VRAAQDELLASWCTPMLREQALQWELSLADFRQGGGLQAATFEFLQEQPADEPAAVREPTAARN
jgi:hypothetical protein